LAKIRRKESSIYNPLDSFSQTKMKTVTQTIVLAVNSSQPSRKINKPKTKNRKSSIKFPNKEPYKAKKTREQISRNFPT